MNRFFDKHEYRREFPRRAFARLDDLEPIVSGPEDMVTFILDAVDADWDGFHKGGHFDLTNPNLKRRLKTQWSRGLVSGEFDGLDGYQDVPIYRIEVSVSPDHRLFASLPRDEEPWLVLTLTEMGTDTEVDVYGGLFAEPVQAFLDVVSKGAPDEVLNTIFTMDTWPDASEEELLYALQPQCDLSALVCFDIGQGLASALVCECGFPVYYFDTGRGSTRNAPTAPSNIDFCTCSKPVVILSHWDTDHWAGATGHVRLQSRVWIVPRQTISISHVAFANDILQAGGKILVVGSSSRPLTWSGQKQDYDLRRCTGAGRNGSGLALVVLDRPSGRSWVLTGDAGYHQMPHPVPKDVAAMIVPHHGANMGVKSIPFGRSANSYGLLFYSFGPGNGHGPKKPPTQHPVSSAVVSHSNAGWSHRNWSNSKPGWNLAGGDVLATAEHPSSHLGGGAAGWNGPPSLRHLSSCQHAMPVPQR